LQTLEGHARWITTVAVTPDGRAVSAVDKALKVLDLDSGVELHILGEHADRITAVAATPDGRGVVSASVDRTLKVWDLERGQLLACFHGVAVLRACGVAPEGLRVMGGGAAGRVSILRWGGV